MDKLKEILEKLKKLKYTGKIEVYINSGGIVGQKFFKEEKLPE